MIKNADELVLTVAEIKMIKAARAVELVAEFAKGQFSDTEINISWKPDSEFPV